jgi:hypothetical protein
VKPETAILTAIHEGATSKAKALVRASRILRVAGSWRPQEELHWTWDAMVRSGRIERRSRAWFVTEVPHAAGH